MTLHLTGKYPAWWRGRRFTRPISAGTAGKDAKTVRDILQLALLGPGPQFGTGMLPANTILGTTPKVGTPEASEKSTSSMSLVIAASSRASPTIQVLRVSTAQRKTWYGWMKRQRRRSGIYAVWSRLSTGRLKVFRSCKNWLDEFRTFARDEDGNIMNEAKYHLIAPTRYLLLDTTGKEAEQPEARKRSRPPERYGVWT